MSGRRARALRAELEDTKDRKKSTRRPARLHEHELVHVHRATEFSDDPDFQDPVWLVREFKRHPQVLSPLEEMFTPAPSADQFLAPGRRPRGRPRFPGSWPLAYLAFVISRDPAMESFWSRWKDSALWREAGFLFVPDYDTVRLRFVEMEKLELERSERGEKTAFRLVADLLIGQARKHEPRIGQVVHVDGTAWQTHARLIHDCPDKERCRALREAAAHSPARASDEEVQNQRHREAAGPEPAEDEAPPGAGVLIEEDEDFKYIWFSTGHRYRTRDKTAGARMHGPKGGGGGGGKNGASAKTPRRRKKKFWLGGIMLAGVDHFLGAPLAIENIAADDHEHRAYPGLMDQVIEAIGECPLAMSGDKAESIKSVFEYNTTRGIASILPWRQPREDIERHQMRTELFDEYGNPRCQYCGSPSQLESAGLGFYFDSRGNPRLRFRCLLRHRTECERTQTISCEKEWRLLIPISRMTPFYHSVRKSHQHYERVFRHWRDRYGVAGKSTDTRLKRPGLPFQHLRASGALVIEWFRICLRYGWLGSARRRNYGEIKTTRSVRGLQGLLRLRKQLGVDLPYGPAAVKLGFARAGPGP